MDIQEQVRNAAETLDEVNPGWEEKINFDTLDMKDWTSCVLAQVFSDKDYIESLHDMRRHGYMGNRAFSGFAPVDLWENEVKKRLNKN